MVRPCNIISNQKNKTGRYLWDSQEKVFRKEKKGTKGIPS